MDKIRLVYRGPKKGSDKGPMVASSKYHAPLKFYIDEPIEVEARAAHSILADYWGIIEVYREAKKIEYPTKQAKAPKDRSMTAEDK